MKRPPSADTPAKNSDAALAIETWELVEAWANRASALSEPNLKLLERFPSVRALPCPLIKPKQDPHLFSKDGKEPKFHKIRVFPTNKKMPSQFWSDRWCFYEIGVGPHRAEREGEGLCVGETLFVHYPNNEDSGKNRHAEAVKAILRAAKVSAPSGFNLIEPAMSNGAAFLLGRRYYAKDHNGFHPSKMAAHDLAWLISETLPKFWNL